MYVIRFVENLNAKSNSNAGQQNRRYVKVAPPTVHAGVGNALRQAFQMDGEMRSMSAFEDLIRRLD